MPFYEVVAYSRTPVQSAAPTFAELGYIKTTGGEDGGGLGWGKELYNDGVITVSTDPTNVSSAIGTRLLDFKNKPMEIGVFRDGVLRQKGPLVSWQVIGKTLVLTARGLMYYTRYMTITTDKSYNTNQVLIAKDFVDMHQVKDYGNYGLVTTGMVSAGPTKEREYKAAELIDVNGEIWDLGQSSDGFDMEVNPSTRVMTSYSQFKGTDKSGLVRLDARGIVVPSISESLSAGAFGSAAFVSGIVSNADPKVSTSVDTPLRANFGLAYATYSSIGVPTQGELDNLASSVRDQARESVFTPPEEFWSVHGATVDDFDTGDVVTFEYDAGFGLIVRKARVKNFFVSVQEGGQDKLSVEFTPELEVV